MITPRGAALLVGSVLLWLVGRTLGVSELFVVGVAAAALVGGSALAVWLSTALIAVRRVVSTPRLAADASAAVTVQLRNDGRMPGSLVLVEDGCDRVLRSGAEPARFALVGLGPGRTATLGYDIHGGARGRYTVGPLQVRLRDPFGLVERVRRYPSTDQVVVRPRVELLPDGTIHGSLQGSRTSATRRLFRAGDEFYALREYVTGDDLRQVHWPSTAHRAKLMVRQHELPWQPEATIFCDVRARAHRGTGADSTLEKAISVAASLVSHLADRRYEVRLATDADDRPGAAPGRRVEDVDAMLDRLADLSPSDNDRIAPALSRLRSTETGGLLVAVVASPPPGRSPAGDPDVQALLAAGKRFGGRLAVIMDDTGRHRHGTATATDLARQLTTAGWTTTVIGPGETLAGRWPDLTTPRRTAAPDGAGGWHR